MEIMFNYELVWYRRMRHLQIYFSQKIMKKFYSVLFSYFHMKFKLQSIVYSYSVWNYLNLKILVKFSNSVFSKTKPRMEKCYIKCSLFFSRRIAPCSVVLRFPSHVCIENKTIVLQIYRSYRPCHVAWPNN